jgi:multidrug/hemolysin transport system ATP-binding protein
LDSVLTVDENLRSRAAFYNLTKEETEKNLNEIVELLDLKPLLDRPVKLLSGGQKRRVDIARSMVHMPKILILDEPSTGLDPKTRTDVWHLIDKIRKETNMTVFLTTHYLEEADQATDVVIIDHGEIIAQGTPTELKNQYAKDYVIVYCNRSPEFDTKFSTHKFKYSEDSHSYFVYVKDSEDAAEFLYDNKGVIKDFEVKKGKMDDVFLNVTGMVNARDEEE